MSTTLLALALARLCGEPRPVLGTLMENRPEGAAGVVGCFVNVLPLAPDLTGAASLSEAVGRVRQTVLDVHEHQALPTAAVLAAATGTAAGRDAWLRVVTDARDEHALQLALPGCSSSTRFVAQPVPRNDLELTTVVTRGDGLRWDVDHRELVIAPSGVVRLLDSMLEMLRTAEGEED